MENNGKWDWLMSYKIKLEDEIIPELEVSKKELREKVAEYDALLIQWRK